MPTAPKSRRRTAKAMAAPKVASPPSQAVSAPNPIWANRFGWYLFSLFIPMAGILIGLFFYDQTSLEARKVGKQSLWIGFLVWVVFPLFILMALLFIVGLAAASWLSGATSSID